MSLQDALSVFLIIGIVTFTVCSILVAYFSVRTLKTIDEFIHSLQNKTLSSVPALLVSLVGKLVRRRR